MFLETKSSGGFLLILPNRKLKETTYPALCSDAEQKKIQKTKCKGSVVVGRIIEKKSVVRRPDLIHVHGAS